jgi:hypothetical protein
MAYVHVPRSQLNEATLVLYRYVAGRGGQAIGRYVAHHIYDAIRSHLHKDDVDHIELEHASSPEGYVLLFHKDSRYA